METAQMKAVVSIAGIASARTVRSGSDAVTSVPTKRDTKMTSQSFLDLVIVVPTCSPIGVMDLSTPSVKSPKPKIIVNVPKRNDIKIEFGRGATVSDKSKIMSATGKTDATDSLIFSIKIVFVFIGFPSCTVKNFLIVFVSK